ncbi:MAG: ABC transporter substrate-binding protein [Planctomycetes bacterium]|nr:ABC transporter substrate-binding protein [Planctomycetota bacterium]
MDPSHAQGGLRLVPTTTAAAELLRLVAGPEDVLALPEQVDAWSAADWKSGGWEKLPRFPRYVAEPLLVLRPGMVVNHSWQAAETTKILKDQGIRVLTLDSGTSYPELRGAIEALGTALVRESRARAALDALDARVARLAEQRARLEHVRALVYTNDGSGGWASGSNTTSATLLALAGLANAAESSSGHAEMSFERLLALDPDLIVTGTGARGEKSSPTVEMIERTSALQTLRARREKRYAVLPSELLSSDSQYLVDAAEQLQQQAQLVLAEKR